MGKKPVVRKCDTCNGTGKVTERTSGSGEEARSLGYEPYKPMDLSETVTIKKTCKNCDGRGWTGYSTNPTQCFECKGEGSILVTEMKHDPVIRFLGSILPEHPETCPFCKGSGTRVVMVEDKDT